MPTNSPPSLFSKNGLIWGQTQSGKTYRAKFFLQECPHYCIFVNTQLVHEVEQCAQVVVNDNVEVIKSIENKNYKICVNYKLDWNDSDSYLQKVNQLIHLIFTIAKNNLHQFKCTIIIDEIDKYSSKHQCSPAIDNLFNRGLRFNINAIGIAHTPAEIHNKLIDASSWFLFYRVTENVALYWKKRGIHLEKLKYGNYEGYYWETDQLWLFSHNRPSDYQPDIQEGNLLPPEVPEPDKMDNSDIPPNTEDLDTNLHET